MILKNVTAKQFAGPLYDVFGSVFLISKSEVIMTCVTRFVSVSVFRPSLLLRIGLDTHAEEVRRDYVRPRAHDAIVARFPVDQHEY